MHVKIEEAVASARAARSWTPSPLAFSLLRQLDFRLTCVWRDAWHSFVRKDRLSVMRYACSPTVVNTQRGEVIVVSHEHAILGKGQPCIPRGRWNMPTTYWLDPPSRMHTARDVGSCVDDPPPNRCSQRPQGFLCLSPGQL